MKCNKERERDSELRLTFIIIFPFHSLVSFWSLRKGQSSGDIMLIINKKEKWKMIFNIKKENDMEQETQITKVLYYISFHLRLSRYHSPFNIALYNLHLSYLIFPVLSDSLLEIEQKLIKNLGFVIQTKLKGTTTSN